MKIVDLKAYAVRQFVFVKILTDDGLYGVGEASLSGRSLAVVSALEQHIKPLLVGQDASRIEFIWQDLFRGTFWRGGPVLQSALAGVDIALWDLAGKSLGVPTYRLLGGAARERVLVYRHVYAPTAHELVERAQAMLAEGWRVLRVSPTDTIRDGAFDPKGAVLRGERVMASLRDALGPEVEIIFEVHTRLTPARAIELCNALEPYRPFFVEDPIRSELPSAFAQLRAHTNIPLGTGEQLCDKWAFRYLIEGELIDYLRVDMCHAGGITEAKKIAAMGEVHYQELALHYTGSPVGAAAMLHLNMAVPNCAVQEFGPAADWMCEVTPHSWRTEDGYLLPSDEPGIGVDLDEEAALAYPYVEQEPPHWRRSDGSVNDW